MKLITIPHYEDYRTDAIFDCYKWDPQFSDNITLSKYALVITKKEKEELFKMTELLDKETRMAEEAINKNPSLIKALDMPKKIRKNLKLMNNYDSNNNVRLNRYDFHMTTNGWMISEVNSDVPGGFAESSLLPKLAIKYLGKYQSIDFLDIYSKALEKKIKKGIIMFVHCTSFYDDRQVMQAIGDKMSSLGFTSLYGASDHILFRDGYAYSIIYGYKTKLDGIVRFTPIEWLKDMKIKGWEGYFNTLTPSSNHPIAIYAQTKKFPFIWDDLEKLGINLPTWRKLLPKTTSVKNVKDDSYFIYKPAWGRVGEKISLKEGCSDYEYKRILKDVHKHPRNYVAQAKFTSLPLKGPDNNNYHLCLGSFAVDGKPAGFYARISRKVRIDSIAIDIPVLIEE